MNLAVIGAGLLGSRHLQGLSKLSQNFALHIVDPSKPSVAEARKRIGEINSKRARDAFIHNSPETLPDSIQLAIIAKTAYIRLSALKALCSSSSVRFLILEKVLFQKPSHFAEAENLLDSNSIKCWVNCVRRAYPDYIDLQDYFSTDPITFCMWLVVIGGWGAMPFIF